MVRKERTMVGLCWYFLFLYLSCSSRATNANDSSSPIKKPDSTEVKPKSILPNKTGKAKFVTFYYEDAPTNDELNERWNAVTERFSNEKQLNKLVTFQKHKCGKAKPTKTTTNQQYCDAAKQAAQAVMALVPPDATTLDDIVPYPGLMRTDCIVNYLRQALRFNTSEELRKTRYAAQPQAERLQPEQLEDRIARFHQASFFVMFYDDPRMIHLWDRMTLEFFGQEHKVTFVAVNCSYTIGSTGDVHHNAHKLCTEYAPSISLTFCTMYWFRAAKVVYKYEAAWTPYDLVKFVEIISRDYKEIKQRVEPNDPARPDGIMREARDNVTGLYKEIKHELDKRYAKNAIDYHEGVHDLTRDNFVEHTTHSKASGGGTHLVFFYTPWDVWSHESSFSLIETASKFTNDADIFIDRVDCYRHGAACQEFNFTSYPQLLWILTSGGSAKVPHKQVNINYPYNYHTFQELERFVRTMKRFVHAERDPHTIASSELFAERIRDADDFNERVRSGTDTAAYVLLYTETGCSACMDVMPYWETAAHELQSHHMQHAFPQQLNKLLIAKLNCGDGEHNLEFCVENLHTSSFPTIVLYRNAKGSSNNGNEANVNEYVFGTVNNRTASVHQLVQFALRSLGAYDVGDEHPSEAGKPSVPRAPEQVPDVESNKGSKDPEAEPVTSYSDLTAGAAESANTVAKKSEFSDSDLNMLKPLGQDFDAKIEDSDLAVIMLTKEKCSMCEELYRPLNRLAFGLDFIPQMFTGAAVIGSVDCDKHANVCRRYGLKLETADDNQDVQIPSLHIFVNGKQLITLRKPKEVQFVIDTLHVIPLPKMEI